MDGGNAGKPVRDRCREHDEARCTMRAASLIVDCERRCAGALVAADYRTSAERG